MSRRIRSEWVDAPRVLAVAAAEEPSLQNFAFDVTDAVLAVEPRLVGLAFLVERCALAKPMDDDAWWAVDALAATLVGPARSVTQTTPVDASSRAVSGDLRGEVTRRRYCAALRRLAREAQAAHDHG